MDITGTWIGHLTYGKNYRHYSGKHLYFEMELVQQRNEIAGFAVDTGGSGTSPDPANILGYVEEKRIGFLKQYESHHYLDKNGVSVVDRTRKGPKIKYMGAYDETTESYSGTWELKVTFLLLWFIPIIWKGSGTWTMKRK